MRLVTEVVGSRLRVKRLIPFLTVCSVLALAGALTPGAKAGGFFGPYALQYFTLSNSASFGNGEASSPDGGLSLVFTGPNDGSGDPSTTDFTVVSRANGLFQFDYVYSTWDIVPDGWVGPPFPPFDWAGYLINTNFYQLADTDGQSGTVSTPVHMGDIIGFRIASQDNQNGAGILTITNFSAPADTAAVPEPGGFWCVLIAISLAIAGRWLGRARRLSPVPLRSWIVAGLAILIAVPLFAQSTQYYYNGTNVTGQLVRTAIVNVSQQQQQFQMFRSFGAPLPEKLPKLLPHRLQPPVSTGLRMSLAPMAATPSMQSLNIVAPSGITGFNALSHLDQRLANNGNQWSIEPPNTNIAVGNGYVLEGVNDAIQVYSISGIPALPVVLSSNQLFGLAPAINRTTGVLGTYLTDMRVYYDHGISRWFVVQRDSDPNGAAMPQTHLYIAVSRTSDPTGEYNIYVMDTTNALHPGCPCLPDFPQIGSDQYGFHIAWNEFTASSSPSFVDAAILSISKASLASGAVQPAAFQFFILPTTGYEFAIQPATTPPNASPFLASGGLEYFASTFWQFGYGSSIAVWAMYNTSSLATPAPNPTLTRITVPTLAYNRPPVVQSYDLRSGPIPYGSSVGALVPPPIDSGDTRVQSLSYAGGRLFLTWATGVSDNTGRSLAGGAYAVLSPAYRGTTLAASVIKQGYLLVNNHHLLCPAMAVNAQGRGAIAVTLVGPQWYPSAALVPFDTVSSPSTLQVAAPGALPDDGFTGYDLGLARWGDYNTAVATSDGSVWMGVEYIGSYPRTDFANWNTYIMRKP